MKLRIILDGLRSKLRSSNSQKILRIEKDNQFDRLEAYNWPSWSNTLACIDLNSLVFFGIQGIILDLDNTFISEDDRYLSPNAETWIFQAKELGIKLFFLSNGKRRYRVEYWSSYFDIPSIHPAKKPFPSAFRKAIKHMNLHCNNVAIIGDSRHTDILGAWLIGCRSIQVASLPHPPRWWEKLFGRYVQISYPKTLDLWEFEELNHYKKK